MINSGFFYCSDEIVEFTSTCLKWRIFSWEKSSSSNRSLDRNDPYPFEELIFDWLSAANSIKLLKQKVDKESPFSIRLCSISFVFLLQFSVACIRQKTAIYSAINDFAPTSLFFFLFSNRMRAKFNWNQFNCIPIPLSFIRCLIRSHRVSMMEFHFWGTDIFRVLV